jgi:hypothetical protein
MALQRERHRCNDDVDRRGFEFIFPMIQIRLLVPVQLYSRSNVCQEIFRVLTLRSANTLVLTVSACDSTVNAAGTVFQLL